MAEKRTIIEDEIKEIESKANNGRNAKKIQRKKAELNALENPDVVVDIDGVVAAPGRLDQIIPDPLQVGWQGSLSGTCDQQVAAILKEQRHG